MSLEFGLTGRPMVVAHRGASATHPENSLRAIEAAIEAGADAVEFDVRVTADGQPVVMHDATVDRTTAGHGAVRSLTLDEVRALGVPTLAEVFHSASGRTGLDIELKNIPTEPDFDTDRERVLEATLSALDGASFVGSVLLSSFNPLTLAKARELEPAIATGLLTAPDVDADVAAGFARDHGHGWVLPFAARVRAAGAAFAERAHERGTRVGTWIVDDPGEAIALMRTGVDAIATNDPAPLVSARDLAFPS